MLFWGIFIGILLSATVFGAVYKIGKPTKLQVPVTHSLGWWAHQDCMEITGFKVTIIDSELNLFKSKSRITYTVYGRLECHSPWRPYIKEVHISEKCLSQELGSAVAEIFVTPIVGTKKTKMQSEKSIDFEFTNSHIINSMAWGTNQIKLTCGGFEQVIELVQRK